MRSRHALRVLFGLLFAGLSAACGDSSNPKSSDSLSDTERDLGPDTPSDVDRDTAPDDPDTTLAETDIGPALCPPAAGGHQTAFDRRPEPARPGALAADFDVETLAGRFHLAERWDGCSSVVVFVHFPGLTDNLWRSDTSLLFTEGHDHVDYLFVSDHTDPEQRVADLLVAERSIEAALKTVVRDEPTRQRWRTQIHYVTGRARELEGGLGDYIRSEIAFGQTEDSQVDLGDRGVVGLPAPIVFGIDREQRFDPGDSLAPAVGLDETLSMAAFLPRFYAFRATTAQARRAETTNRFALYDAVTTSRVLDVDWLPPEGLMIERLDFRDNPSEAPPRVEATRAYLDLEVTCDERNPFACSEWDRIANVFLCTTSDCGETLELARWITPYWRRGLQRYRLELSHLLPLIDTAKRLRIVLGPDWERPTPWHIRASIHLAHDPDHIPPRGVIPLFGSAAFDDTYPRNLTITVPAEATRVEVHALISGHGQTASDNCAEWCDHRHVIAIDGAPAADFSHGVQSGPAIGEPRGCAQQADRGVIPGQWGNWAQQRAYWCPGLPVDWQVVDLGSALSHGQDHLFELTGTLGESTPPRGGDIAFTSYLVWY